MSNFALEQHGYYPLKINNEGLTGNCGLPSIDVLGLLMSDTYDGAQRLLGRRAKNIVGSDANRRSPKRIDWDGSRHSVKLQSGLPLSMAGEAPIVVPNSRWLAVQLWLKRVLIDIPLSALALIVLSPLLLGVAIAVRRTSKGPALFRQARVGLNGKEFMMLKFRTMRSDACDDTGLAQVVADDDRVTPIGRFLRATSLDELPQLWNILVGDMAIIGPRPMVRGQRAAGADYFEVVPYYDYRHRVKPGLSGWAQANGLRGPTTDLASATDRIDHDCAYVQNFSLALDVRIIFRTITREFLTGSGV
jgi:lipopolysaccharide/colanic/teichoic acid biosynthesis glycosyltransferase